MADSPLPWQVGNTRTMFAQAVADPSLIADDLIGTFLPIAMLVAPFVLAIAVKFTSESEAKKYLSAFIAVLVGVLSLVIDPPAEITLPVITARLMASWPVMQAAYLSYNALLRPITSKGLNGLLDFGNFGIQVGRVEKAIDETRANVKDLLG